MMLVRTFAPTLKGVFIAPARWAWYLTRMESVVKVCYLILSIVEYAYLLSFQYTLDLKYTIFIWWTYVIDLDCPRNTFNSDGLGCSPCPQNSFTHENVNATSLSDCLCLAGYRGSPELSIPCTGEANENLKLLETVIIWNIQLFLARYQRMRRRQLWLFTRMRKHTWPGPLWMSRGIHFADRWKKLQRLGK